ncbi:MAG: TonB-dependent receptor [Flavobacteriaceae bacterium]|nr:TonB-dependent receptor [Flavobacteriaceae bacterium]
MNKTKIRSRLAFTVFILFVSMSYIQAQDQVLTIIVTDTETQLPLQDVNILINPCACGGITNMNGVFSKKLKPDTYQISIQYLGYGNQAQEVVLTKNTELNISLSPAEETLSEIIVLARRRNKNVETPQMGVLEVSARDLIKLPTPLGEFDVLRSMTMMAGVNSSGDVSNGISIRGGSLDQNLMLFESAPVFNPTHLFGLISVFTPDVISGVNVYQANIPARYGGRIASVVDVKVKSPLTDKTTVEGGIGLISSRLTLTTPLIKDKLFLLTGGRAGFTDFLFPLLIPRLKNTKANFIDSTTKLMFLPNANNQVSYTYFNTNDFYQLDLITNIENINAAANQYDFVTSNHTFRWLHTFENTTSLTAKVISSSYRPKNLFPEADSDNVITFDSRIQNWSNQLEFADQRSEKLDFYVGAQWNANTINPGSLDPGVGNSINPVSLGIEKSLEISAFTNLNWNPFESLSVSAGLRQTFYQLQGPYQQATYDTNGNRTDVVDFADGAEVVSYNNLEPRLGARYLLGENSSLKMSYARLHQYVQNIYNTATPLPTSRWKMSDRYILPQKNDTYGLGYYIDFDNDNYEFGVEGYYRDTENNLTYKPGANFFLADFLEREITQADGKTYGVEVSARKSLGKINGFFNYTYSRSLLKTNEAELQNRINNNNWFTSDFDRPHTVNANINFEGDAYNSFNFTFTAQTGRPYSIANGIFEQDNQTIPIFLERNNSRLPTYHRLDFSWKIAYSKDPSKRFKSDWVFTLYNVYSRKNPYNIYFTQREGSLNGDVFGGSPLGAYEINVLKGTLVSLTYNFKFQ